MKEVEVQIKFDQHCLGDIRTKGLSKLPHAPDGRVMLLPTWWQALMRYAASVVNRHHDAVKAIDWDPVVEGEPREYKRFYGQGRYTRHEAFYPGDVITVRAVLPSELAAEGFQELLRVAGRYKGISPYRKGDYGRFEVVTVTSVQQQKEGPCCNRAPQE